jgi:hypothetical protein
MGAPVGVDFDVCAMTGMCARLCRAVLEIHADVYLYVLREEPEGAGWCIRNEMVTEVHGETQVRG